MTKDQYLEMCEMLGNQPKESEIPVEFEDLPLEVQEAHMIYSQLQDNWDYMNGNYIGKNFVGFTDILDVLEVAKEDRKYLYKLIGQIDKIRAKNIKDAKPSK